MFKAFILSGSGNLINDSWPLLAITGGLLTLSAVLIFILPELVAYLLATLLFWGGATLLGYAFSLKKQGQNQEKSDFGEVS